MSNGKKVPPVRLDELEEEEEEGREPSGSKKPGSLSYQEKPARRSRREESGGGGWRPAIVTAILSVIFSAVLVFGFSARSQDVKVLDDNIKEVATQVTTAIADINKSLAGVEAGVDTAITEARSAKSVLGDYALKSEIPGAPDLSAYTLKSELPTAPDLSAYATGQEVDALQLKIDALQTQVTSLASSSSSSTSTSTSTGTEARWDVEVSFLNADLASAVAAGSLTLGVSHKRIEGAGTYSITLEAYSANATYHNIQPYFQVVLVPDDLVQVNEDATYLDSSESPWFDWDEGEFDYRTRRDVDYCRRVTFESSKGPYISIGAEDTWEHELEFELEYIQ